MHSNLRPNAAAKGKLRQSSIQLAPETWDYLDLIVGRAIADERCIFTGRVGRGDVIGGLCLAAKLNSDGLHVPVELLACGIHQDEDGDCLACGSAGYHLKKGIDTLCPLCNGEG